MGKISKKEKEFYLNVYRRIWGITDIFENNYGLDKNSFNGFYQAEYESLVVGFLECFAPNVDLKELHDNLIEIVQFAIEDAEEKELFEYCDLMLGFKIYIENMSQVYQKL